MSAFESNNVLTIKTVQIAPFRTLMTALKDILLETNITFKKDGIRIINMDKSHTMLAHLFLAVENFEHSDWGDRLFCYHAYFQEFVEEIEDEYDVIISNPPFYTSTYKELSVDRAMARHAESLPYDELLKGVAHLLSENGICAFIIPFSEEENFIALAKENGLLLNKTTYNIY